MIVKLTCFVGVHQRRKQVSGTVHGKGSCRSEFKNGDRNLHLILHQFDVFGIIVAATRVIMHFHTALSALLGLCFKQFNRHQFFHAVMGIDHHTTAGAEINKDQYGCDELLHTDAKIEIIPVNGR